MRLREMAEPPEKIPLEEVQRLAAAGRSEREIITTLRSQGYSNEQISKALNRVLKFTVGGDVAQQAPAPQRPVAYPAPMPAQPAAPPAYAPAPPRHFVPPPEQFTVQAPPEPYVPQELEQLPSGGGVIEMTAQEEISLEELIEEIINEKWKDVEAQLSELDRLYGAVMERLDALEQRLDEVLQTHESASKELKTMLTETTDHLQGLEGRISSVERAFKEFLPSLTDNVRALSKIVESVKQTELGKKREEKR